VFVVIVLMFRKGIWGTVAAWVRRRAPAPTAPGEHEPAEARDRALSGK
jgi:hypothetical protein